MVESLGVVENTGSVDDGNDLLVGLREQDLVRTEVSVGSSRLYFGDLLALPAELVVDTLDILSDRKRGHSVRVVGLPRSKRLPVRTGLENDKSGTTHDSSKGCRRLSGGERLPKRGLSRSSVSSSPVHEPGSS